MANAIKLKTLLRLIDEHTTVYFVVESGNVRWASTEEVCRKAIQQYKSLLSWNVVKVSTDCEGAICIEIRKNN